MPEEEILQEIAEPKKKREGGGLTFVHLIIMAVVIIVITAAGTFMVQKSLSTVGNTLTQNVNDIRDRVRGDSILSGRKQLEECKLILPLKEEPMIINLADGDHYLSIGISVCLDDDTEPGKKAFEDIKPKIIYACTEFLSTLTKADLFPGVSAAKPSGTMSEDELALAQMDQEKSAPSFSKRMDEVRGSLLLA
ncbi:MAG TPA: flagellar basal body-associated FliL family protein, partial [bacterium]|nr:flagellar basal body-associated FliL family protein [bacterium]